MREMLSIYNLGENDMAIRNNNESSFGSRSNNYNMYENNPNEEIISLGDDFGKY